MNGSFLCSSTPHACRLAFTAAYGGWKRTTSTLYRNDYLSSPLKDSLPAKMKSSLRWTGVDVTKFEEQINMFVRSSRPTEKVHRLRADVIKRIRHVVATRHGQQYSVEQFGSSVYGVDSHASDLDLVLLDHSNPNGFRPGALPTSLPDVYNLNTLANTIRKAKFAKVYGVPASIPIVKGVDKLSGLSTDLNTNDRLGLINTHMIKRYCELSPLLVPMLYFIKAWAKLHGLNSPSLGGKDRSLSSYCYALMTIGYLQYIKVLPNLQEGLDKIPVSENLGYWVRNKAGTEYTFCDTRYDLGGRQPLKTSNISLAEAVNGWFWYWGFGHRYERNKLAIRLGGVTPRQHTFREPEADARGGVAAVHKGVPSPYPLEEAAIQAALNAPNPEHWRHNLLVVEDPFIRTKNVAGNIQNHVVELIKWRCRATFSILNTTRSAALALTAGSYQK